MKYILLMHGSRASWDDYAQWPKKDLEANIAFMSAFSKELEEAGAFVASAGLGWPDQAKIVRAGKDGEPVTDGVFPESKEFLAGYWIIDVESPEQAYKFAARLSLAPPQGTRGAMPVEVRQVLSGFAGLGI